VLRGEVSKRYPYSRFYRFKEENQPWFRFRVWLSGVRLELRRRWERYKSVHLGGARRQLNKLYPFRPYSVETGKPIVSDEKIWGCRTKHGPAVIQWNLRAHVYATRVENAKLPDGTRGTVQHRMPVWRRPAKAPLLWIWGRIEIKSDDVLFLDNAAQPHHPHYEPDLNRESQLERELTACEDFVLSVQDDRFAVIAYRCLNHLKWMRIGEPNASDMNGHRSTAAMIAGLRGKGEDYLDYYCEADFVKVPKDEEEQHALHLRQILRNLGWRTFTAGELKNLALHDFQLRVSQRLAVWQSLDHLEARPPATYPKLEKKHRIMEMPLYQGDDPSWLDMLSSKEKAAISADFVKRVLALAQSGRITEAEFNKLLGRTF
jgi:hypothetical protein